MTSTKTKSAKTTNTTNTQTASAAGKKASPAKLAGSKTNLSKKSVVSQVFGVLINLDESSQKVILVDELFNTMQLLVFVDEFDDALMDAEESPGEAIRFPANSPTMDEWIRSVKECPLMGFLLDSGRDKHDVPRILPELVGTSICRKSDDGYLCVELHSEETSDGSVSYFFEMIHA